MFRGEDEGPVVTADTISDLSTCVSDDVEPFLVLPGEPHLPSTTDIRKTLQLSSICECNLNTHCGFTHQSCSVMMVVRSRGLQVCMTLRNDHGATGSASCFSTRRYSSGSIRSWWWRLATKFAHSIYALEQETDRYSIETQCGEVRLQDMGQDGFFDLVDVERSPARTPARQHFRPREDTVYTSMNIYKKRERESTT